MEQANAILHIFCGLGLALHACLLVKENSARDARLQQTDTSNEKTKMPHRYKMKCT